MPTASRTASAKKVPRRQTTRKQRAAEAAPAVQPAPSTASPAVEHFGCGSDHRLCRLQDILQSLTDERLRRQLASCLLEVERFGERLQLEIDRKSSLMDQKDQFLANILRDSADAIITLDLDDRILSWNKGAENIYGYSEEEMLGQTIEILRPPEQHLDREIEYLRTRLLRDGFVRNFKTQRVTKSGRRIEIIISRTAIRNERGKIIGSCAIVKDVTHIKNIEKQLARAEHFATLGEMAASLAHEIKNPLAGIKGVIEVIMDYLGQADPHREVLEDVIKEVSRIDRIVKDLLGYAHPRQPEIGAISIKDIFRRVILLFARTIQEKRIDVRIEVSADAEVLYADENLLEQILLNLVLNAVQAMTDSGRLTLTAARLAGDDVFEIGVADNGPGIPRENLSRIFQPFFTTKESGTGLGLATCRRIANDHGGNILVESALGQGATFLIQLPLRLSAPDEYAAAFPEFVQ